MYKLHLLGANKYPEDFLSPDEKEVFKPAVHYVLNLKTPPMDILLQNGFGEWEFQYEKNNVQLSGRIDLWGRVENKIWIVDYKSGKKALSQGVWSQLSHYGFVLRQKHPKTEILLCAIQLLSKKAKLKPSRKTYTFQFKVNLNQHPEKSLIFKLFF